jgi:hypothetical protein
MIERDSSFTALEVTQKLRWAWTEAQNAADNSNFSDPISNFT